jgi:acyl transferase domain-containing protein/NAD(P)-dependent dehydrogenase (short-subunit alcohol dehydrogenase family)/acyl carrier protein
MSGVNFRQLLEEQFKKTARVEARLSELVKAESEPIAIVGIGCRFPGGAHGPLRYWRVLEEGVDAVVEIPPDRWSDDGTSARYPGVRWAGLLDEVRGFDAAFFGISPREALSLDPQQRFVLEVAWEALEDAGIPPSSLMSERVGVFMGITSLDYQQRIASSDPSKLDAYGVTGNILAFAAGRLSYTLGFEGPAISLDTACSSSLVTAHLAVQSLRKRECRLALAGGVNLLLSPVTMRMMAHTNALSPDGRCHTFDAAANGYVRSEGCGVIVLKRLSDAEKDGDRVWAVIRGSAVNQDGRSTGLTTPNVLAQKALLGDALKNAGIDPADVGYVEAHGTGTALGDPIEIEALKEIYGSPREDGSRCAVASVKTNFGHLEAAAGVAGLIKAALALKYQRIPKHLHFRTLNPRMSFEGTPFFVPTETVPWTQSGERPRRAGVSSFGISGTNAHLILEEAPAAAPSIERGRGPYLLPLSAKTPAALEALSREYLALLSSERSPEELGDICFSASRGRTHHPHRVTATGQDAGELREAISRTGPASSEHRGKVVFVFSGHGSQWVGMGRELLEVEPAFKEAIEACDRALSKHVTWSLLEALSSNDLAERLERVDVVQPMLFAMGVGLARLWESYGVTPDAVMGQSMGEIAAAHVSGALSLEDAAKVVCLRSRSLVKVTGRGGMMVTELDLEGAERILRGFESRVSIASSNSPRSTLLSGEVKALEDIQQLLEAKGIFCRVVKVNYASHSPEMDPLLEEITSQLHGISAGSLRVPMYSTVKPRFLSGPEMTERYWAENLRLPVMFSRAVEALASSGHGYFIEMSPHPVVAPSLEECLLGRGAVIGSLRRSESERKSFFESLGALYCHGFEVDWRRIYPKGRQLDQAPTYPWQHERFWLEVPKSSAHARYFERALGAQGSHFRDHVVDDVAILPASAYLDLALSAIGPEVELEQIELLEPMVLEGEARRARVAIEELSGGRWSWQIVSESGGAWTEHVRGRAQKLAGRGAAISRAEIEARMSEDISGRELYPRLAELGFGYGERYRLIDRLSRGKNEALAHVKLFEGAESDHRIHPALLDACLQALIGAASGAMDGAIVPVAIESVRVHGPVPNELWSHARALDAKTGEVTAFDEAGRVVLELRGVRGERLERARQDPIWTLEWERTEPSTAQLEKKRWVLIGEAPEISRALTRHGAEAVPLGAAAPDGVIVVSAKAGDPRARWRASCGSVLASVKSILAAQAAHAWRDLPRLYLVTSGAQAIGGNVDPYEAMLFGMGRTIDREHPELRCARIDLARDLVDPAETLVRELASDDKEEELVLSAKGRFIGRIRRRRLTSGEAVVTGEGLAYRLEIDEPGRLDKLVLRATDRRSPEADEVEIAVFAAGLNFLDVLRAMGVIPDLLGSPGLGLECTGVVTRIGASVEGLSPGDRVLALAGGAFGAFVTTPASAVVRAPGGLDLLPAATLLIPHLTAYYSLAHVARLQKGERVLIHAAAGGVGLAAIQWARHAGAEIIATAGSEAKRDYLASLGLSRVSDSRSGRFVDDVLAWTNGEGVDVVLSSLSGEFIEKSFELLRDHGRFVELGKRDYLANSKLGLRPFLRNLSFSLVDLLGMLKKRPETVKKLLLEVMSHVEHGILQPLPFEAVSIAEAESAFRTMAQGRHTGKLVLAIEDQPVQIRAKRRSQIIHPDRTHLVTGGLGGLGLSVAAWLVSRGAKYLALMGRSGAETEEQKAKVAALEDAGAKVMVLRADVADKEALSRALDAIAKELPPIVSVFHLAGVLSDATIAEQTEDRLDAVMRPKVLGAENLHELTKDLNLELFVLYSSAASLFGSPGQSNYAAANAYLDALAERRRQEGLPAMSIGWGPFTEVGLAAKEERRGARLSQRGATSLSPEAGAALLSRILDSDAPAQLAVIPLDVRHFVDFYPAAAASPLLSELIRDSKSQKATGDRALLEKLTAADSSDRARILESFVRAQLAGVLRMDPEKISASTPLKSLGIDSLMGLELRNRIESALGLRLSATLVWTQPHVQGIAALLDAKLAPQEPEKPAEQAPMKAEELSRGALVDELMKELD